MRLIDADALMRMICGNECGCTLEECGIEENEYDPCACNYRGYIEDMPTIEADPVNRAAILRLCNEIEDIACDIGKHTMMDVVYAEAQMIFYKAEAIGKELTGDAGTN